MRRISSPREIGAVLVSLSYLASPLIARRKALISLLLGAAVCFGPLVSRAMPSAFNLENATVPRTLTVASSNPNSGVAIVVSPNDLNGQGNGTTQFTRSYDFNTLVTLTAPAMAGGNNFQKWQRNGVDLSFNSTINFIMDNDYTMTAVYGGAPRVSTVGKYDPTGGAFYLKNTFDNGGADTSFTFGPTGGIGVAGDWNGDGIDTIGVFKDGFWYLKNSNSGGNADLVIQYGATGDQPIVGDWNNDGIDTLGVFFSGGFFLRNSNTPGPPDITLGYGVAGDLAIAGDWNGDGIDTVGVYAVSGGAFFLTNSHTTGIADISFTYGYPNRIPVIGDWNGDGVDTVGILENQSGGWFFLRNSNSPGFGDLAFVPNMPGNRPISGRWVP